jgi:hypothetical protein
MPYFTPFPIAPLMGHIFVPSIDFSSNLITFPLLYDFDGRALIKKRVQNQKINQWRRMSTYLPIPNHNFQRWSRIFHSMFMYKLFRTIRKNISQTQLLSDGK